jgi:hypothetical protein
MGLTEAAAQKRLTRALEKLGSQFQLNGLIPDAAITSALVALNVILWAGLYQPAQDAWSTKAESGSMLTLVRPNRWKGGTCLGKE